MVATWSEFVAHSFTLQSLPPAWLAWTQIGVAVLCLVHSCVIHKNTRVTLVRGIIDACQCFLVAHGGMCVYAGTLTVRADVVLYYNLVAESLLFPCIYTCEAVVLYVRWATLARAHRVDVGPAQQLIPMVWVLAFTLIFLPFLICAGM